MVVILHRPITITDRTKCCRFHSISIVDDVTRAPMRNDLYPSLGVANQDDEVSYYSWELASIQGVSGAYVQRFWAKILDKDFGEKQASDAVFSFY